MKRFIAIIPLLLCALLYAYAQQPAWLELPGGPAPDGTVLLTQMNGSQRSHTFLYDEQLRISRYVAYPLNAGLIGEGSRTDGWEPYPGLPQRRQPSLSRGFAYGSGYDRGHQIPSADRLDYKLNRSTFVYINATPQLHDFNGGIWAELEKVVRTWAKRSDTLYVVTGVIPGENYISDNDGRPVNIPKAYWKAVLRRITDKSGATRWSMASVVLPHRALEVRTWRENLLLFKTQSLSIEALEAATGLDLFASLSNIIGRDEVRRLKAADPSDNPWWWK